MGDSYYTTQTFHYCGMSVLLLVGVATCCIALLLMISFLRVSAVQEHER